MRLLLRLVFWPWFLAALVVGRLEMLARLPRWAPLAIALALAALILAAAFGFRAVRAWLADVDLRYLVGIHVVRLYGLFLLALHARGALPYGLVPAAWSDVFVAALAVAAVVLPLGQELRRHVLVIWNTVGLMGLLLGGLAFARIAWAQPWLLEGFHRLPLSLLPTFFAPLLLAVHVIIYIRLRPAAPETASPA